MKKLCLIRHAQSSWLHAASDYERPLEDTGVEDVKQLAKVLHQRGLAPDLILTSPAKRCFDTSLLIAQGFNYPQERIIADERLYEAKVEDLLSIVQKLDGAYNTVMLIGHNPGITELINYLTDEHLSNLPAGGAFSIGFNTDSWQDIIIVEGKTLFMETPDKQ